MKEKISTNKILALTSLVFGILSLFSFVLYFYSANHAPYTYFDVIFWGPLCSFIGIVFSPLFYITCMMPYSYFRCMAYISDFYCKKIGE